MAEGEVVLPKSALTKIANTFDVTCEISLPKKWPLGTYKLELRSKEDGTVLGDVPFTITDHETALGWEKAQATLAAAGKTPAI